MQLLQAENKGKVNKHPNVGKTAAQIYKERQLTRPLENIMGVRDPTNTLLMTNEESAQRNFSMTQNNPTYMNSNNNR